MVKISLLVILLVNGIFAFDKVKYIEECRSDNIESCFILATELTTGSNARSQDSMEEGMGYMRKACVYGDKRACDRMADNYFNDKSYGAARPFLVESCERGVKSSCERVGIIYRDGHDIRQNDTKAREFFEKACVLKSGDACHNVAIMYRGGFGVDKNRTMEKRFYKKGCENGLKVSCNQFTILDNEDKGIETGIWADIKGIFK